MPSRKNVSEEFSHQPFKNLKKLLETNRKKDVSPISRKGGVIPPLLKRECLRNNPCLTDEEIFHNAMKEVKEIREFRDIPVSRKRTVSIRKYRNTSSDKEALAVLEEIVEGKRPVNLSDTQEYVEWINQDYREDVIMKLHRGQYSVQDCLDLHGIIVEEGKREVEQFFRESLKKGYRCIKIIHGRGLRSVKGPVMKEALVTWLLRRHRKNIAAFVTARQCDGGLGALYVLLK
jgi:DNA-nicking Smr family endonuclease